MKKAKTVDEYIKNAPKDLQDRLTEIRKAIKAVVPEAMEKISYAMPYYGYKGRLVYFAYFKNHIGLYIPPPITKMFAKELEDYETHMATIRFPHNKKLSISLVKKLIKARVKLNEEK